MVTSKAKTVEEYVKTVDEKRRPAIVAFRRLVKKAVPKVTEGMTYGMPTYSLGKPFVAFNAQKNYLSFYIGEAFVKSNRAKLGKLDCGKGCIRGRKLEDFPLPLLETMVKAAAKAAKQGGGAC